MNKISKQLLNITSGRNFRELGGYQTLSGKKIKYHKLLRTGNLADLTPTDLTYLSNYGVKYVIDFRSQAEVKRQPDRIPDGAQYVYDPVFSEDLTNSSKSITDLKKQSENDPRFGFTHMFYAYEDMIESKTAQAAYRKFFAILLNNSADQNAVIFHCTAGKDRTGFAALLILTALGVPLSTIKQDYLLTNITIKDFINQLVREAQARGNNQNTLQSLRDIQSVQPAYINHVISVMTTHYGSINNYLRTVMKLSSSDFMALRQIYLTD